MKEDSNDSAKKSLIDFQEAYEDRLRLELAVDAVNMAWWSMDVPTGEVRFHKRKAEMLGYAPEDFKHYSDFMNLVFPEDQEPAMEAMRKHFRGEGKTYETHYRIRTSKGGYLWFYDIGSVVSRNEVGYPLKVVGFVIDITKQKMAELEIVKNNEELRELNAEKDKLFSIIAHDLRSPLSTLMQTTEILLEDYETMTEIEKISFLKNLNSSANNTFKLLENLLQWANIKRGVMPFDPIPIKLKDFLLHTSKMQADQARLKGIEVEFLMDDDVVVFVDPNMLQAILRNLLSNAVKFTERDGKIVIGAAVNENKSVEVFVKDNGIGMPVEMLGKLFKMGEKVGRKGTEGELSSGLGLLLVKDFVDKLGGDIEVKSEIGIGSEFRITLPI